MSRAVEDCWTYPRPAVIEPCKDRIEVLWKSARTGEETVLADTTEGYRALETTHPPTYYVPPSAVQRDWLQPSATRPTFCEWKGQATYWDLVPPGSSSPVSRGRIFSYNNPTPSFKPITGYFAFYADPLADPKEGTWICKVAGEVAKPQEGHFYSGWINSWISGGKKGFKGGAGTWGW